MTHPHNLAAIAAFWALSESSEWVRPTIEAEATSGRPSRPLRPRDAVAVRRAGTAWRADRSELVAARVAAGRAGLTDTSKGLGDVPAPVRPELLDAQHVAGHAQLDLLVLIGQAAADRLDNAVDLRGVIDLRTLPIHEALAELDIWRAATAAAALAYADRVVRRAVREPDSHEVYEGMCPGCGTYGLVWETAAPDSAQWTVLCAYGCRCEGEACGCGLTERVTGCAHRWEASVIAAVLIGAVTSDQVSEGMAAA